MSQKELKDVIDPEILAEDPSGEKPKFSLRSGVSGIVGLNRNKVIGGVSLVGLALAGIFGMTVASDQKSQQEQAKAAKPAEARARVESKTGGDWYDDKPDGVAGLSPQQNSTPSLGVNTAEGAASAPQGAAPGAPLPLTAAPSAAPGAAGPVAGPVAGKPMVPNLDGQGRTMATAATSGMPTPTAGPGGSGIDAAEEQRRAQALQQALSSGLTVSVPNSNAGGGPGATAEQALGALAGRAAAAGLGGAGAPPAGAGQQQEDPNKQGRKEAFMSAARTVDSAYSPSVKTVARSPYEVKAGSVIPSVMISGISSDLPGQVIAQVRENVWDSRSGRYLLIPQGSRLIGLYDSHVAFGQRRVLLAWSRIIYPDGSSFDLKGMPGTDAAGFAGFKDQVDNHYARIFGAAALMSLISAGVQLSQPNNGGGNTNTTPSVSQTVGAALGQQLGQVGMNITQKNLNIQPTLEIRPGYKFNVMVTADMILPPVN